MTFSNQLSFIVALICAILTFSGMQMYKPWFISSQLNHILGGYLGSVFFVFIFTAVGNLEACIFGKSYQAKLFPEVIICLFMALFSTVTLHRVSVTTCLIFSSTALYYINRYAQRVQSSLAQTVPAAAHMIKKRK